MGVKAARKWLIGRASTSFKAAGTLAACEYWIG
jgi:hypothetical protein